MLKLTFLLKSVITLCCICGHARYKAGVGISANQSQNTAAIAINHSSSRDDCVTALHGAVSD